MTGPAGEGLRLRILYRGGPLPGWRGGPADFGVQDKSNGLHPGVEEDGGVGFDLRVEMKPGDGGAPVFIGPLAHGPPAARFLYLSWRNPTGEYARRLKLALGSIGWDDVAAARRADQPLTAELLDQPKLTSTGAHIGGSRTVVWKRPAP
jgi:hypothetical protein